MSDRPSLRAPLAGERAEPAAAWWRFGIVWFMFAGPAIVVVAGFATMAIAFRHADVEIHDAPVVGATRPATAPAAPPWRGDGAKAPIATAR